MRYVIMAVLALAMAGCSTIEKLGNAQQNPVVQGTLNVASRQQCEQFAKDQPDAAKTTGQYLSTLAGASAACAEGIRAGLTPAQ